MTQNNFNLQNYIPLMSTVYAEAPNHKSHTHQKLISEILHKAESGHKQYGAHTGSLMNVLRTNYASAKTNSEKYQEGMTQNFKTPENENNFKKVVANFSGIMRGSIPRVDFSPKSSGRKTVGKIK